MIRNNMRYVLAFLVAMTISPSIFAQVSAKHFFISADYGHATYKLNPKKQTNKKSPRYSLGYQLNQVSGMEISYLDFGPVTSNQDEISIKGWTFSSKNRYKLSNGFAMFARVGYSMLEANVSSSAGEQVEEKKDFFYGGGIEIAPFATFSILLSYDLYKLETFDTKYMSAGLVYRF